MLLTANVSNRIMIAVYKSTSHETYSFVLTFLIFGEFVYRVAVGWFGLHAPWEPPIVDSRKYTLYKGLDQKRTNASIVYNGG